MARPHDDKTCKCVPCQVWDEMDATQFVSDSWAQEQLRKPWTPRYIKLPKAPDDPST